MSALVNSFQYRFSSWLGGQKLKEKEDQERRNARMITDLHKLEHTMDTLLAAQTYNDLHSPLARLPEELLLKIVGALGHDEVALRCVRRVSRTFRRIIPELITWDTPPWQFIRHLRRDGMCRRCLVVAEPTLAPGWLPWLARTLRTALPESTTAMPERGGCCFGSWLQPGALFCDTCGRWQHPHSFSHADRQADPPGPRTCLGRQGGVRLCEHVHIYWEDIEAHVLEWRRLRPGKPLDWQGCLDTFRVECRDPVHDLRCSPDQAPTWPCASLRIAQFNCQVAVLQMMWAPHSGLDAFTRSPGGPVPVSELRALFGTYREGAGGALLPSQPYPGRHLPEMVCFEPGRCACADYKKRGKDGKERPGAPRFADFFRKDGRCDVLHFYWRRHHSQGHAGERVYVQPHWPTEALDAVCLVTLYRRDILICDKAELDRGGRFNPGHEWFHAMDADTYDVPGPCGKMPLCRDTTCMNYYLRPSYSHCTGMGPFEGFRTLTYLKESMESQLRIWSASRARLQRTSSRDYPWARL